MVVLLIIFNVIIKFYRLFYYEFNKMNYKININWLVILIFFIGLNIPNNLLAKNFNEDVRKVRAEINRDNLEESIKLLGKINVTSDIEKDEINLLFGDIYLKINKPQKAEEFYEKSFMTTNERIESLTFIGLAEVKLRQGQIDKAIDFAERSIAINSDFKYFSKISIAELLSSNDE